MSVANVLIIGVTGCVGHYLFDAFSNDPNYQLHLLIRPDAKIKFDPKKSGSVTVCPWRIADLLNQRNFLMQMDYVIHVATVWGGNHIWQTNVGDNVKLFEILGESPRLKKIIYFSTASILGEDGKPTRAALELGTGYVRSKWMFHQWLPRLKVREKVISVFPTWVFGGDANHPYSHASEGIPGILKMMNFFKRVRFDFRFHFMHAVDIATTVKALLESNQTHGEFILGQEPYSFNQLITDAAQVAGQKIGLQIPISFGFIQTAAKLLRKEIAPWDKYCFNRKNFIFNVTGPQKWGRTSVFPEFMQILKDSALKNK